MLLLRLMEKKASLQVSVSRLKLEFFKRVPNPISVTECGMFFFGFKNFLM